MYSRVHFSVMEKCRQHDRCSRKAETGQMRIPGIEELGRKSNRDGLPGNEVDDGRVRANEHLALFVDESGNPMWLVLQLNSLEAC